MGAVHLLPGTTFGSIAERGDYDSKHAAMLTLRELERYIGLEIAGRYHQSIHSGLKRPPIAVWNEHEGETPLRMPQDRLQFWVSFLPDEERKLRPDGIHLFGLRYWSSALTADSAGSRKNCSSNTIPEIWLCVCPSPDWELCRGPLRRPDAPVHYSVGSTRGAPRPHAKGRREVDMHAIVRTAIAQRTLVDDAKKKTRVVRQGRNAATTSLPDETSAYGTLRGVDLRIPVPSVEYTE